MAETMSITQFACPSCRSVLEPGWDGLTLCPECRWKGYVYLFTPRPLDVVAAEQALPEDATCIHHPRKKAIAVCAGTGDLVCALCAVELDGQTYSAEYLNTAGKTKAGKAFDRHLPRPDSQVLLYCVLVFVPYVNFLLIPLAFLWIPHAFMLYPRALKLRQQDPLFARVMSKGRVIMLPILLGLYSVAWLVGAAALLYHFLTK